MSGQWFGWWSVRVSQPHTQTELIVGLELVSCSAGISGVGPARGHRPAHAHAERLDN